MVYIIPNYCNEITLNLSLSQLKVQKFAKLKTEEFFHDILLRINKYIT